jgi:hypothetical protein
MQQMAGALISTRHTCVLCSIPLVVLLAGGGGYYCTFLRHLKAVASVTSPIKSYSLMRSRELVPQLHILKGKIILYISVPDQCNFGVDPDPDPRIHASD